MILLHLLQPITRLCAILKVEMICKNKGYNTANVVRVGSKSAHGQVKGQV